MNRQVRFVLTACLILICGLISMGGETLRVGSFNLRCPKDKAPNDWGNRAPRVLKTITEAKFDVFGTQEVVPEYINTIQQRNTYRASGHSRASDKDEAVTIFYNPKRLELLSEETFWLSETPAKCSTSWGSTVPRIATACVFRDKRNSKKFIFVNTHLQHLRMYETQKKQLNVIFERLKLKYDLNLPIILVGDFNSHPHHPAPELAATFLRDAKLISRSPAIGPKVTYHGYQSDPAKRRSSDRIDYIFVSSNVTVLNFATIDNFDQNGLASSDHYPLAATIVIH